MKKTNAARLLDRAGICYTLLEYEVDPGDLDAEHTAAKLQLPAEQVFKTLVLRASDNSKLFAVVPANRKLDLKAVARLAGVRTCEPVASKDLESLTGYVRGGVTVPGAKRKFPIFVDSSIMTHQKIAVSAGKRGLMLLLGPASYLTITQGETGLLSA